MHITQFVIAFVEKRKNQRPNWNEYLAHSSEPAIEQSDIFYSQVFIVKIYFWRQVTYHLIENWILRAPLSRFSFQKIKSAYAKCEFQLYHLQQTSVPFLNSFYQALFYQVRSLLRCSSKLSMKSSAYSSVNSRDIPLLPEISSENSSQN